MADTHTAPEYTVETGGPSPRTDPGVIVGQRVAFALASLLVGLASLVNLLGLEKGLLAVAFGWMALKRTPPPALPTRRWWAWIGIALGALTIVLVGVAVVLYQDQLREMLEAPR